MIFNLVYSKPKYASIVVSYPSGGVCTCTDGTKTLTAEDTSGSAIFHVSHSGTWIVEVIKGELSNSEEVNVASLHEIYTVMLQLQFYIFKEGEGAKVSLDPHAGSYHTAGIDVYATANYNSSRIYIRGNTAYISETESHDCAGYVDTAEVDFTNYSKLCIDSLVYNSFTLYVRKNNSRVLTKNITTTSRGMTNIDISSLTGNHVIRFYASGIIHSGTIYNAYLEES